MKNWTDLEREIIWYMLWYLLTESGVPPGGSAVYNCIQVENKYLCTWREVVHKTIQKHRTYKMEGKTYTARKQT